VYKNQVPKGSLRAGEVRYINSRGTPGHGRSQTKGRRKRGRRGKNTRTCVAAHDSNNEKMRERAQKGVSGPLKK